MPVFGILEKVGIVRISVVPDVSAKTLTGLTIKTVKIGDPVYRDKFRSYDGPMFYGYRHLKVNHNKRFPTGKAYINALDEFWSWARERIIKYHGLSKGKFPLYLKEL